MNSNLGNLVINDASLVTLSTSYTELKRYRPGAGAYILTVSLFGATGHSMRMAVKQNNAIISNAALYSGAEMSAEINCTALCVLNDGDFLSICASCGISVADRPITVSIMQMKKL